ncbi:uncharacterized protein [Drosophila kikkawai]|uniref:Uncharacterized protein n=1 Tax=Drosophila kikkawai TaxID=30033 RepID=A0A6P4JSC8_DROKI|nr:uncharacterized protein LOC108085499 [Drosophila kikkawai]
MKTEKKEQSTVRKRTVSRVNSDSSKNGQGSSANPLKKLKSNSAKVPKNTPSQSGSTGLLGLRSFSQALPFKGLNPNGFSREPGKKAETIWFTRNARQTSKVDAKKITSEEEERSRTIKAICMRLQDIDVPENIGIVEGPVSFEEIFDVLGLDEKGEERKETQVEPTRSECKVEPPVVKVPVKSLPDNWEMLEPARSEVKVEPPVIKEPVKSLPDDWDMYLPSTSQAAKARMMMQ